MRRRTLVVVAAVARPSGFHPICIGPSGGNWQSGIAC